MIRLYIILVLALNTIAMSGQLDRERLTHQANADMLVQEIVTLEQNLADLDPELGRSFCMGDEEQTICRTYLHKDSHGKVFRYSTKDNQ